MKEGSFLMKDFKIETVLNEIRLLKEEKKNVIEQKKCGILSDTDTAKQMEMIRKKEIKAKEKLVNSVHVTNDGMPRKIKYMESQKLYRTKMADGSYLSGKSEEILIEKLFQYYALSLMDTSMKGIFDVAIKIKAKTENCNQKTIEHNRSNFNRFISNDFAKRDITSITKDDLKEYTQEMVNRLHPKKKAFFAYKSVLNIIFQYALEKDIISENPVTAIKNSIYYKSLEIENRNSEVKILSPEEIEKVKETVAIYKKVKRYKDEYFINGYAILFSIETGMRAGELPALKWSDIKENYIHIHAQQLCRKRENGDGKEYYYAGWTKNEKGVSKGGREFPLTNAIKQILSELKAHQERLHIESEYIFCHENGEWIKTESYETCLRRMLKSLGYQVTNNHAFRMSLNSNVFIPLGIPETERARLLGHTVEVNLKYYSFSQKNNTQNICNLLNGKGSVTEKSTNLVTPRLHQNIIKFEKAKSLRTANSQAF